MQEYLQVSFRNIQEKKVETSFHGYVWSFYAKLMKCFLHLGILFLACQMPKRLLINTPYIEDRKQSDLVRLLQKLQNLKLIKMLGKAHCLFYNNYNLKWL